MARWLALNPAWLGRQPGLHPAAGLREAAQIWIGPPPTLSNQPPPQELDQMLHIARKFDVAGRDERIRALGRAGEERVLAQAFGIAAGDVDGAALRVDAGGLDHAHGIAVAFADDPRQEMLGFDGV